MGLRLLIGAIWCYLLSMEAAINKRIGWFFSPRRNN